MVEAVRVAGVQLDVALGEVEANLGRIERYTREAAAGGAKLVVFPEAALTGYCFETFEEAQKYAQAVPGPATERMSAVCRELGVFVVFGMVEGFEGRIYNAAVVVGPEGLVGKYRKIHLPFLGLDRFVTPGECEPVVYDVAGLKIGVNICYDGSFPEPSRLLAIQGVDLIVLPTNWPPGGEVAADGLTPARALENHIYYMAVNRIGEERGFTFIGKSRLISPHGAVVGGGLAREEKVFYGEVRPDLARNKHLVRVPGKHEVHRFRDRRPDLYGRLAGAVDSEGLLIGSAPVPAAPAAPAVGEAQPQPAGFAEGREPNQNQEIHKQLWAPWRLDYVTADQPKAPPQRKARPVRTAEELAAERTQCFICQAASAPDTSRDREMLVVARSPHSIAILNRFPYNNGHILVAPLAHKAHLDELTPEEAADELALVTRLNGALDALMKPDGFNVGLNLGKAAGAGLPGHLHWHLVPRWNGDVNFMPSTAGVRVVPQSLDAAWQLLTGLLRDLD